MEDVLKHNILVDLALVLDIVPSDFSFHKASLLQGVLMEKIDTEYAEQLHQNGRKPYSQCVEFLEQQVVWHIRSLSDQAYQNIILRLMNEAFDKFELRHDDKIIRIKDKHMVSVSLDDLFKRFYSETAANVYRIEFLSPTAFKKNGNYYFYPEIYNIYQSLMKRFDEVSDRGNMFNQDTLDQLADNTEIVGYSLHTTKFSLEGVRIPAFMGSITVKIHGTQTMCNFAKLLFEFGNYSGVGIKTSIGMGNVKIIERRKDLNDRTRS